MSLRLLVDEDSQARLLVAALRAAGHDVRTAAEAGLNSLNDAEVLRRARAEKRALLTHNCDDFRALHEAEPDHPGILAVYQHRDPARNMSYAAIVRALRNIEASGWNVTGQFMILNAWNYVSPEVAPGEA